jgi:DNA-binding transcriptional LysR family regulator
MRGMLEKLQGRVEAGADTAATIQQVNISLPSGAASTVGTQEVPKNLPGPREILSRLDEIFGRLQQLELQTVDSRPLAGSFHGYEFGGQFMMQLHWFARWYETFTIDVGLLLIEVVRANNSLKLEIALQGDPLGVLPSRAAAVDEALKKGVSLLAVTPEGAALTLTEKGRQLLEAWRSWGSQAKQ